MENGSNRIETPKQTADAESVTMKCRLSEWENKFKL